jgi:hypothetical protein
MTLCLKPYIMQSSITNNPAGAEKENGCLIEYIHINSQTGIQYSMNGHGPKTD